MASVAAALVIVFGLVCANLSVSGVRLACRLPTSPLATAALLPGAFFVFCGVVAFGFWLGNVDGVFVKLFRDHGSTYVPQLGAGPIYLAIGFILDVSVVAIWRVCHFIFRHAYHQK